VRAARELVAHLEELSAGIHHAPVDPRVAENEELRRKLDAAALAWARRQSELEARAWRITELEEQVAEAREALEAAAHGTTDAGASAASDAAPVEPGSLAEQLDVLRQALAQEHAARTQLESGEALTSAKAEIASQAATIAQLRAELAHRDARGR
jgi:chromosome segregation ATPase